jgi:hypothetical protein
MDFSDSSLYKKTSNLLIKSGSDLPFASEYCQCKSRAEIGEILSQSPDFLLIASISACTELRNVRRSVTSR